MTIKKRRPLLRIVSILIVTLIVSILSFNIYVSAAPAVVAVGATAVAVLGLFAAMGLISPQSTQDSIFPSNQADNSYFWDTLVSVVAPAGGKAALAAADLVDFYVKSMPQDLYYTDGTNYYIDTSAGLRAVTSQDVYISAEAVVATGYTMPVNIVGLANTTTTHKWDTYFGDGRLVANISPVFTNPGIYATYAVQLNPALPYWASTSGAFAYTGSVGLTHVADWRNSPNSITGVLLNVPYENTGTVWIGPLLNGLVTPFYIAQHPAWVTDNKGTWLDEGTGSWLYKEYGDALFGNSWVYDNHTFQWSMNDVIALTVAFTDGIPATSLSDVYPALKEDKGELEDTWVNVKPAPELPPDDDDDEKKHYYPPTPDWWELFKDIADIINDTSEKPSNNNTTLGDFINNNFNYNTVVVEAPDIPDIFTFYVYGDMKLDINADIDADVNLGGSLTVNINYNEDVDLPEVKEDDGKGLIDMGVTDVIGGLTTHNPVVPTLTSLFESIDPTLRALFITGISLSILLALWKLIRG